MMDPVWPPSINHRKLSWRWWLQAAQDINRAGQLRELEFKRADPITQLLAYGAERFAKGLDHDLALDVQVAAQPLFPARPVGFRSTSNYGLGHVHVVHCAGDLTAEPARRLLRLQVKS
jgi:hypothetical protein